jgi:hypothetical protein
MIMYWFCWHMQLTVNIYNDLELKCSQLMIDNDNVMFDNNFVVLLSLDFPAAISVCFGSLFGFVLFFGL